MKGREIRAIADGESIRIRFNARQKRELYREKERTGRSVSDIVRQAVREYFAKR